MGLALHTLAHIFFWMEIPSWAGRRNWFAWYCFWSTGPSNYQFFGWRFQVFTAL